MSLGSFRVPTPVNEPVRGYAPGSPEKAALKAELARMRAEVVEIPMRIGGARVDTKERGEVRAPHERSKVLARYAKGGKAECLKAVEAAGKAQVAWGQLPWEERAAVFLRAADLLAGSFRDRLNASTMLGQSKNAYQAEIDAACEMIDFFRFNVAFAERLYGEQPLSGKGQWNRMEHRPLEGFVFAVTPFNFTSIAGNLPTAPALMGNTVVWKPAATAMLSAHFIMELLEAAGLPPGVINLVAGNAGEIGEAALSHPFLAGVHFTGSTGVFNGMWKTVGERVGGYRTYPRLVGETGGKDFVVVHPSADPKAVATALVRGAFEYQGQKCSAASRAYVPKGMWAKVEEEMGAQLAQVKMGPVEDFRNFVNAVIDAKAYASIKGYVDFAKDADDASIVFGGKCDDREGFFVEPTVISTSNPKFKTMVEEIFGPVLTVHPYPDKKWSETLALVDSTSPYALTGAVFANDRGAVAEATAALRNAAGNFYVNDKPTGAVVGQQPFGGARASGTNDKAGSVLNLLRWVSPRSIKETFEPPTHFGYPFLGAE